LSFQKIRCSNVAFKNHNPDNKISQPITRINLGESDKNTYYLEKVDRENNQNQSKRGFKFTNPIKKNESKNYKKRNGKSPMKKPELESKTLRGMKKQLEKLQNKMNENTSKNRNKAISNQ